MSANLLKEAWRGGYVSRLTVVLGLLLSAAWAVIVALITGRFIVGTLNEPELATPYRVAFLILVVAAVLILVIPMPAQWLMYVLLRLRDRRRNSSGPRS